MAERGQRAGGVTGTLNTGRLGGRVRTGSVAFHRKNATLSARSSMAEITQRYSNIVKRLKQVTPEAIRHALTPAYELSQMYVPVDTGNLRATGLIRVTEEGNTIVGNINYGGPDAPYAAIVHERMDLRHTPPTRAKYLQSAMEEEYSSFLIYLATTYMSAV